MEQGIAMPGNQPARSFVTYESNIDFVLRFMFDCQVLMHGQAALTSAGVVGVRLSDAIGSSSLRGSTACVTAMPSSTTRL